MFLLVLLSVKSHLLLYYEILAIEISIYDKD